MTLTVRRQLVTSRAKTYAGTNQADYVTVHETANTSRGANAAAHANLQARGNVRAASWHYQVDDREAVQSFPDTVRCWHAGDGRGPGNLSSIAIEICVNSDGDYAQALANAAELVRQLRARHGIPRSHVVQHHHWSGKDCPRQLRRRDWQAFVASTDPDAKAPPASSAKARTGTVPGTSITLVADGVWGRWTRTAYQHALRAAGYPKGARLHVDGVFGRFSRLAEQQWLRARGQRGHAIDGDRGRHTIRSLQAWLRAAGYTGHAIDGVFGRYTITSLQHALIDGKVR